MKKKPYLAEGKWIYIIILIFTILLLYLNHAAPMLYWDENTYLANARGHISETKYTEDFRFPLLSYVISAAWLVTGESILAAKLMVILLSVSGAYFFYLICREFLDEKESLVSATLFCTNYLIIEWGFRAYTDMPGLALLMAGFHLLIKNSNKCNNKNMYLLVISGMLFGAAFLMRFTYGLFFAIAGSYMIFKIAQKISAKNINKALALMLGWMITLAPWLIYNKIVHKKFLWNVIQQYNIINSQAEQSAMPYIIGILKSFGPMLVLICFGAYFAIKLREERLYIPLLFVVLGFVQIAFFTTLKAERYLIPIIPFALLVGMYGLRCSFEKGIAKKMIIAGIIIFSVFLAIAKTADIVKDGVCDSHGALAQSIYFIEENTDAGDTVVSNVWPWFGYYNNIQARSMWTDDISKYRERDKARYIIYHENMGDPFDKGLIENKEGIMIEKIFAGCDGNVNIYRLT